MVDKIISDLAAFDIVDDPKDPGLALTHMAPGVIVAELREKPEAEFVVLGRRQPNINFFANLRQSADVSNINV